MPSTYAYLIVMSLPELPPLLKHTLRKLVQDYGDASIAAAFLIPQDCDKHYLEYLLRRYKGHFYQKRYPSLSIIDA